MTTNQAVFNVEGMTCNSCVRHVDSALRKLEGVQDVRVSLEEKKVTVKHDSTKIPADVIGKAIAEEGYPSKQLI